jgi:two-component system LytT family sensor kinase
MDAWVLALAAIAGAIVLGVLIARWVRGRARMGTESQIATYRTLHIASLAAPALRGGLTESGTARSVKYLRGLLGVPGLAITDRFSTLAWDGIGDKQREFAVKHAEAALDSGSSVVLSAEQARDVSEMFRSGIAAPLTSDDVVIGALVAYSNLPAGPALMRAVEEVATFTSGQLDLAELDRTRARSAEAEVRVLRAQISPHFIFNSLTAIASFVRTDPDRARELLLDFAEFTRYSFRSHGRYTALAEELRSVEQYLLLEQARFGDRLQVKLRVDPEVLSVRIPFLCIQPLVENAVRHGLESRDAQGTVSITAIERGPECWISVEDDGVGNDPQVIRRSLSGEPGDHVGLANVDERLRQAFGDDHGLVVETAPMAGTKVTMRIPKYAEAVSDE